MSQVTLECGASGIPLSSMKSHIASAQMRSGSTSKDTSGKGTARIWAIESNVDDLNEDVRFEPMKTIWFKKMHDSVGQEARRHGEVVGCH